MFIGREKEMNTLEKAYAKESFQFFILYGRRRVGKTRLMVEFTKGKNVIFFSADENNDALNLSRFSEVVLSHYGDNAFFPSFSTWEGAFRYIGQKSRQERLVLAIDELPYLVQGNPSFLSAMQTRIDHDWKDSQLFLMLCGSSVSFMEDEVLAHKSPLFGRKTGQLMIMPFDYYDTARFFPSWTNQDKMMLYGILGGTPQYLLQFSQNLSLSENIKTHLLDTSTYLYDEPKSLMRQELRTPSVYNGIVEAIALGATKPNEVASIIDETPTKANKYMTILQGLQIVTKDYPAGDDPVHSRKARYRLVDPLFCFSYRFIYRNRSMAEQGMITDLYSMKIEPELPTYMGRIFELACIQFLQRLNRQHQLPFVVESFHSWWGGNPVSKQQEEIDIVGLGEEAAIYGECKYRHDPVGMDTLQKLMERSQLVTRDRKFFYLFSNSGFTNTLLNQAKNHETLRLFTLDDLYQIPENGQQSQTD